MQACFSSNARVGRAAAAALGAIVAVVLGATPASAAQLAEVRVGAHPGFTRVVLELDAPAGYRLEEPKSGGTPELLLELDATAVYHDVRSRSPHVRSVKVEPTERGSRVRIGLHTSDVHVTEMILARPSRIVLDVRPVESGATTTASRTEPRPSTPARAASPKSVASAPSQPAQPETAKAAQAPSAPEQKPAEKLAEVASQAAGAAAKTAETAADSAKQVASKAADSLVKPEPDALERAADEAMGRKPAASAQTGSKADAAAPQAKLAEPQVADEGKPAARPDLPSSPRVQAPARRPSAPVARPAAPAAKPQPAAKASGDWLSMLSGWKGLAAVGAVVALLGVIWARARRRQDESLGDALSAEEDFGFDAPGSALSDAVEKLSDADEEPAAEAAAVTERSDTPLEPTWKQEVATMSSPAAASTPDAARVEGLEKRIAELENRLAEFVEARERIERQLSAQTEELRVQRAAIARTQRVVRSMSRPDDAATEPVPRPPAGGPGN